MDDTLTPLDACIVVLPDSTPTVPYGLYEVFAAVGQAWTALTGEAASARPIRPRLVSVSSAAFGSAVGLPITPQAAFADIAQCDLVVVGDLSLPPGATPAGRWPQAAAWVRAQYEGGALVCSVCTGSLLLAEAGLLDEMPATTHWCATALFRTHYPRVQLHPERILVPAGPGHRLVTSGGQASWEDLALYLVARLCGEAEAVRCARIFIFGDRSEGQLPFAAMCRVSRHEDAAIARCQAWIAEHYPAASPVAGMVASSGLSERSFKRRFKAATGLAPLAYVHALRIEEAKHLLERSDAPVEAVAAMVGYDDPAFFRRLFKRTTSITPAHYRRRFCHIGRLAPASPVRTE
jgi:transcriptional regulator GlxA family with amidase domain